jgi:hypothetical protein
MRYRSEYAMLELPAFVRRVVMPIVYLTGRVIGKYAKYREAPQPMMHHVSINSDRPRRE